VRLRSVSRGRVRRSPRSMPRRRARPVRPGWTR
jgi:hypothetical protein